MKIKQSSEPRPNLRRLAGLLASLVPHIDDAFPVVVNVRRATSKGE